MSLIAALTAPMKLLVIASLGHPRMRRMRRHHTAQTEGMILERYHLRLLKARIPVEQHRRIDPKLVHYRGR